MWTQIVSTLVGGVCATMGGFLSMWYQTKKARRIKFEETIGEKMVCACGEALSLIIEVKGRWVQCAEQETIKYVEEKTHWIWQNRAFLPSEFYNAWHSARQLMRKIVRRRDSKNEASAEDKVDACVKSRFKPRY